MERSEELIKKISSILLLSEKAYLIHSATETLKYFIKASLFLKIEKRRKLLKVIAKIITLEDFSNKILRLFTKNTNSCSSDAMK